MHCCMSGYEGVQTFMLFARRLLALLVKAPRPTTRSHRLSTRLGAAMGHPQQEHPPPTPPPPRYTHFVSLRLSHDARVVSAIERLQENMRSFDPRMEHFFVEPCTAHITLCVLALGESEVADCATLLGQLGTRLAAGAAGHPPPDAGTRDGFGHPTSLTVPLSTLGSFGENGAVVYVGVREGPQLDLLRTLAGAVRGVMAKAAWGERMDTKEFVPHVTVAKVSRVPFRGGRGGRGGTGWRGRGRKGPALGIPRESWEGLSFDAFDVPVATLELLAMAGRKPGEYYDLVGEFPIPVRLIETLCAAGSPKAEPQQSG